jgi:hypothetical protein
MNVNIFDWILCDDVRIMKYLMYLLFMHGLVPDIYKCA